MSILPQARTRHEAACVANFDGNVPKQQKHGLLVELDVEGNDQIW